MCKVFAMTNMSKVKITKKFLNAVKAEVCRTGDKHGFGYAVLDDDGSIGGERTLRPLDFSPLQPDYSETVTGSLPIINRTRDRFGELNFTSPKSFIGHGRYSTNDIALVNTHPFYNGSQALIHNGVVSDPDNAIPKSMLETTNDTEILLRCWEQGGLKKVADTVTGYYAFAILDKSGILTIVRDDTAMLYVAYSRTVDSFIFATTAEIIRVVCKKMSWAVETPEEVIENISVTFNGNEIVNQEDFEPRFNGYAMSAKAKAALGNGDDREYYGSSKSYDNYSAYEGYMGSSSLSSSGVFDATLKTMPIAPEDEPEPSYRESAQLKESQAFTSQVENEEFDRKLAEASGKYEDFNANNLEIYGYGDNIPTNGIDGIGSSYDDDSKVG